MFRFPTAAANGDAVKSEIGATAIGVMCCAPPFVLSLPLLQPRSADSADPRHARSAADTSAVTLTQMPWGCTFRDSSPLGLAASGRTAVEHVFRAPEFLVLAGRSSGGAEPVALQMRPFSCSRGSRLRPLRARSTLAKLLLLEQVLQPLEEDSDLHQETSARHWVPSAPCNVVDGSVGRVTSSVFPRDRPHRTIGGVHSLYDESIRVLGSSSSLPPSRNNVACCKCTLVSKEGEHFLS
jgi:hypothetical protein